MDDDTLLQELPSCHERFRRVSRPTSIHTPAARSIHTVMRQLEQIFDPHGALIPSLRDVTLVSLDLEYDYQQIMIDQIGISTFEVNQITMVDTRQPQSVNHVTSNHLYLLRYKTIPRGRNQCQYRYGEPIPAKGLTIQEVLLPILAPSDMEKLPNIVLVGQSIDSDLLMLKRCGFDTTKIPNIISFIDIAPVAAYLQNDSTQFLSLKQTCRRLGIRTCGFHNAGHDALYTLQALLLLFCQYKLQREAAYIWTNHLPKNAQNSSLLWECQIDSIKYIAEHMGNVLWTGSARQRQRKQIFELYKQSLTASDNRNSLLELKNVICRSDT